MMDDTISNYNGIVGLGAAHGGIAPSEYSLRKRSIPKHPKGFNNDWGAIMQHQAEVEALMSEEQKQKE